MTTRIVSAPGKLVLAGEYAVLAGHVGLSMAVDRRVLVTSKPADKLQISGLNKGPFNVRVKQSRASVEGEGQKAFGLALCVFEQALAHGFALPKAHIHVDSSALYRDVKGIKTKLGLGSSAAVASCLAAIMVDENADSRTIFELAYRAHKQFSNQRGSGIDVATSCLGGLIHFEPATSSSLPTARNIEPGIDPRSLICVFSGKSQNTRNFIDAVQAFAQNQSTLYNSLMQALGDCASELENLIRPKQSDWQAINKLIDHNLNLLDDLGKHAHIAPITDAHRLVTRIAHQHGGCAKPSGAGGGDVAICFVPPERRQTLWQKLVDANLAPIQMDLFASGVG